ncbi:MAG TPA: arylsulfotransferase family protein [Solirubrobacteraceae bacterium]|nr:arylsulfotransferase family protein [Solirubrobacteraceae bacterium]
MRLFKTFAVSLLGAIAAVFGLTSTASSQAASTTVVVFPTPGDRYETPQTQIVFRGVPVSDLGAITVTGSRSGPHSGRIEADSDGQGASFLPARPFLPRETVTVRTSLNIVGGRHGSFSFQIAKPGPIPAPQKIIRAPGRDVLQRFHSAPTLAPAKVVVTRNAAPVSDGDIFVTPQAGPSQNGAMIFSPNGQLVWWLGFPIASRAFVTDLRVQRLAGQPVLTYWVGQVANGNGRGEGVIDNQRYQRIATVRAGNGLSADLHEFLVTNSGDAWIISALPVILPSRDRPVMDSVIQEVDIRTGLVLYQWNALDHINASNSYTYGIHAPGFVLDPYHLNSISFAANGDPVVSMRNMDAMYEINRRNGRIVWELGGRHSSFTMGAGTRTAFQHDAVVEPNGDLTIFDDGAGPPVVHAASRGIEVRLDERTHRATLVRQVVHSPNLLAYFEGSVQELPQGRLFLGWGQQSYFTEFSAKGKQIYDAHLAVSGGSYRAYRQSWTAQPFTKPALATGTRRGRTILWASWNGATTVAQWRVLSGSSSTHLTPIGRYRKTGFETALTTTAHAPYVEVQALDARGKVLAGSQVERVR